MLGRQKCIGCGRLSPETHGDTTLTTSYKWRVRRADPTPGGPAGGVEWRCPACWHRFKVAQKDGAAVTPPSTPPPPAGPPRNDGNTR